MRPVAEGYSPGSSQPLHELLTISFSGCVPATKNNNNNNTGAVATEAASEWSVRGCLGGGQGTALERASPPLTWRPPPRRPAARTLVLSGPRPAERPAARLPALQAASSPRGGDAGGAVTMETAAAARGSQAGRRLRPGAAGPTGERALSELGDEGAGK